MMLSSGQTWATLESERLPSKKLRRRVLVLGASLVVLALMVLYVSTKVASETAQSPNSDPAQHGSAMRRQGR